jgi:ABC-type dipeptide/oligopeptide/nickel transport system permease component
VQGVEVSAGFIIVGINLDVDILYTFNDKSNRLPR